MGGLLYNAFIFVKGKRMIWIMGIATILFILTRVIFPGWRVMTNYVAYDENGIMSSDLDIVLGLFPLLFAILGLEFINMWNASCIESDRKNKICNYLAAMPLCKNAYVASKYVFIGIATFVFFSLTMVWNITEGAFSIDAGALEMTDFTSILLLPMFAFSLFVSAEELLLFLVLGKKKAMMIKVGVMLLLGIAVIGFLLFGDLPILERIDLDKIVRWIKAHQFEVALVQIFSPVISLLIYFGSYKLSCYFYSRKERDYD